MQRIIKNFFDLFYPKLCVICAEHLFQSEEIICAFCRHDLPLIDEKNYTDNKIVQTFYGRVSIEKAISFLFYRKKGKTKILIHQLKYKKNQEIGTFLGNWFGHILKESKEFKGVDYIVPVPLHPKKLKKRGYNQLTTFGEQLSKIMMIPYKTEILIRTSTEKTQTFKHRFERFSNIETKFYIENTSVFKNKYILLIDDVITTGATLEACCKEILKSKKVKISIVTIAFTE